MSHLEQYIKEIESKLPDLVDTAKLIKLGIFSSIAQAVQRRKRGEAPEYLRLSEKRILYPKNAVISWLKEKATLSQAEPGNKSSKSKRRTKAC